MNTVAVAVLAVESGGDPGDWLRLARSMSAEPLVRCVYWCGAAAHTEAGEPIDGLAVTAADPWQILLDSGDLADPAPVALLFAAPVEVPAGFVARAVTSITADRRNALTSFLSDRRDPTCLFDESRAGRRRDDAAAAGLTSARINGLLPALAPVRIDRPGGWVQAVDVAWAGTFARRIALGGCAAESTGSLETVVRAAGNAAIERGFRVLLDPAVYLQAPPSADGGVQGGVDTSAERSGTATLVESKTGGLEALALVRPLVFGLDIAIDATCLGPFQSGTQVQVVELASALAAESRVRSIRLASRADGLPNYAEHLAALPKIQVVAAAGANVSDCGAVDVIHRPFQPRLRPARGPWGQWSQQAARTVLTVLDLINFDIPAYVASDHRLQHRRAIALAFECVDRVITISGDVATDVANHCFDIPADRISVVPLGVDHLSDASPSRAPEGTADAIAGGSFLLMLGTDLMHKNRDLAIEAWLELRRRGYAELGLVLLGHHAERGSSVSAEAAALRELGDAASVLDLEQVTEPERNWWIQHAAAVLYPTAAEGFGLVPFEAARLGTPTVWVPFGPLAKLLPSTRGTAVSWSPDDLADAAQLLLSDAAAADESVRAVLDAAARLTWEQTATMTVDAYLAALSMPKRAANLLAEAERLGTQARQTQSALRAARDRLTTLESGRTRRASRFVARLRRRSGRTQPPATDR